jgi:hypothetical protein
MIQLCCKQEAYASWFDGRLLQHALLVRNHAGAESHHVHFMLELYKCHGSAHCSRCDQGTRFAEPHLQRMSLSEHASCVCRRPVQTTLLHHDVLLPTLRRTYVFRWRLVRPLGVTAEVAMNTQFSDCCRFLCTVQPLTILQKQEFKS